MRKHGWVVLAAAVLSPALGFAQGPPGCPQCPMSCPGMGGRGSGGWGRGPYGRRYDLSTVETLAGQVVAIDRVAPAAGMSPGIHLALRTSTGDVSVHLGPAWFLDHQDTQLEVGDRISVLGSRVRFDNQSAVLAAEVRKGDQTLVLRDQQGLPLWRGWR